MATQPGVAVKLPRRTPDIAYRRLTESFVGKAIRRCRSWATTAEREPAPLKLKTVSEYLNDHRAPVRVVIGGCAFHPFGVQCDDPEHDRVSCHHDAVAAALSAVDHVAEHHPQEVRAGV